MEYCAPIKKNEKLLCTDMGRSPVYIDKRSKQGIEQYSNVLSFVDKGRNKNVHDCICKKKRKEKILRISKNLIKMAPR